MTCMLIGSFGLVNVMPIYKNDHILYCLLALMIAKGLSSIDLNKYSWELNATMVIFILLLQVSIGNSTDLGSCYSVVLAIRNASFLVGSVGYTVTVTVIWCTLCICVCFRTLFPKLVPNKTRKGEKRKQERNNVEISSLPENTTSESDLSTAYLLLRTVMLSSIPIYP